MSLPLVFRPVAQAEFHNAAAWYFWISLVSRIHHLRRGQRLHPLA